MLSVDVDVDVWVADLLLELWVTIICPLPVMCIFVLLHLALYYGVNDNRDITKKQ